MSGLFGSLTNNVKALNAQSRAIETAGRNLANVNNPHYARQRVLFGDRGTVQTDLGPQSLGLEALGITQLRDALLDKQVLRETALESSLTNEQAALQKAQAGLGENIDRSNGFAGRSCNRLLHTDAPWAGKPLGGCSGGTNTTTRPLLLKHPSRLQRPAA